MTAYWANEVKSRLEPTIIYLIHFLFILKQNQPATNPEKKRGVSLRARRV